MRNRAIIAAIGVLGAGIALSVSNWNWREDASSLRPGETVRGTVHRGDDSAASMSNSTTGSESAPQSEAIAPTAVELGLASPPEPDAVADPGPLSDETLLKMSAALVESDPASALEWAQQVNTTDMRLQNELVYAAFTRLAEQDAIRAARWLDQMPAGQARDEAARILVGAVMERDAKAAFAWASSIGNAKERSLRMELSLNHWLVADEPAARAGVRRAMSEAVGRGDVAMVRQLTNLLENAQRLKRALRY